MVQALEDLIDRSDRVDYAIALHSFAGGLFPTVSFVASPSQDRCMSTIEKRSTNTGFSQIDLLETSQHEGVRTKAAELVALAVQNNPPCQAWAFEGGALPKLLALHAKGTEKEKQKCLLALSGLISNNPPAQEAFIKVCCCALAQFSPHVFPSPTSTLITTSLLPLFLHNF